MSALAELAPPSGKFELTRAIELPCVALCIAQAVFLGACYVQGYWLVKPDGAIIANDFVNVWAAGRQVLECHAAAAYDHHIHKAVEDLAVGHAFDGEYPWNYPPTFLFVAAALSLMPLIAANLVWLAFTFPLYVVTVRAIVGERVGLLFACAFPGILANLSAVQNGFVTAALIGGALLALEGAPVLAGCLIGLLTFKPHFGLLFPLVLLAGGHWRAIGAAAATAVALAAISYLAFGPETWSAFIHALPVTSQAALTEGRAEFAKLQTLYALVRMTGGPENLAWAVHGAFAVAIAAAVVALWRLRVSFDIKAAAFSAATLLVTPYLFMYDLAALAIPMAFLVRASLRTNDTAHELARLVVPCALILSFFVVKAPVGLAAVLVVAGLIARRARLELAGSASMQFEFGAPARAQ
jgi:arabinofuranan 3-O-arabinosyltransferase